MTKIKVTDSPGTILSIEGNSLAERKAVVRFEQSGTKTLLLKYAKMKEI